MPEEQTQPTTETITLHSAGPIAGIPGNSHAPGTYLVDWVKRTIKLVEDTTEAVIEHVEEMVHPSDPAKAAPADAAPTETAPAETPTAAPEPEAPPVEPAPAEPKPAGEEAS